MLGLPGLGLRAWFFKQRKSILSVTRGRCHRVGGHSTSTPASPAIQTSWKPLLNIIYIYIEIMHNIYIYIFIYICIYTHICLNILDTQTHIHMYVYIYVYILVVHLYKPHLLLQSGNLLSVAAWHAFGRSLLLGSGGTRKPQD